MVFGLSVVLLDVFFAGLAAGFISATFFLSEIFLVSSGFAGDFFETDLAAWAVGFKFFAGFSGLAAFVDCFFAGLLSAFDCFVFESAVFFAAVAAVGLVGFSFAACAVGFSAALTGAALAFALSSAGFAGLADAMGVLFRAVHKPLSST
ncbi:MAG: hypothetical protein RL224_320 [Actinomycetota bacterium]